MAWPNPQEIAVITVNSGNEFNKYNQWETVFVQHKWADSSAHFEFTTAEFTPMPTVWGGLKCLPGDMVQITLGGQIALINGIIIQRQVGYGPSEHGVQLSGKSLTWIPSTSSLDPPQNFDGMGIIDIATQIYGKYGVGVKPIGNVDNSPYPRLQSDPGVFNWDFLETNARTKGVVLGSTYDGQLLLIGDHAYPPNATLEEGKNILRMNFMVSIENVYAIIWALNQAPGGDDMPGEAASAQRAPAAGDPIARNRNLAVVSPAAVRELQELEKFAHNEAKWSVGTKIQATVTVQGWMRPGTGQLWQAGDNVSVYSPMAPLNNQTLKIATLTFRQDRQSGTTTQLDLVAPWLLNDKYAGFPVVTDPSGTLVSPQPLPKPPIQTVPSR
jgi:prophage tail gpP-like protein